MRGIQVPIVPIVAAEQLIAAIAADDDFHMSARELREQPGARGQGIRRLIERADQIRQERSDLRRDACFVMLRSEQLRDGACSGRLVIALIVEACGERRQTLDAEPPIEHGDEQARIHSTAQESADRHVAHHVKSQRFLDVHLQFVDQRFFGTGQLRGLREVPVASNLRRCPGVIEGQETAGRQFVHALEHRKRRVDETQRQVLIERRQVQSRRLIGRGEDRLDLRRESEAALIEAIEEGFLSQMIASGEQAPTSGVPERESEHASQSFDEPIAVPLV